VRLEPEGEKTMLSRLFSKTLSRRGLFKVSGMLSAPLLASGLLSKSATAGDLPTGQTTPSACTIVQPQREAYWTDQGRYFVQPTLDDSRIAQGIISARIDGQWQDFPIRQLNENFVEWNFTKRTDMLNSMMTGQLDMYNDIHNAAVATYGARRGDSAFSLNVAYKGTGWVPKPEYIEDMTQDYWDHRSASMATKMGIIRDNYDNRDLWRRDIIGSLELYTQNGFETHSFLNQMANPISVICFHDTTSYEVRCITQLMHPDNPDLSDEQYAIHTWINYAHDFFHGEGTLVDNRISVIYWVVEQFDKSPMGQTSSAGGYRVVPPM
jgi:hypothetical protein